MSARKQFSGCMLTGKPFYVGSAEKQKPNSCQVWLQWSTADNIQVDSQLWLSNLLASWASPLHLGTPGENQSESLHSYSFHFVDEIQPITLKLGHVSGGYHRITIIHYYPNLHIVNTLMCNMMISSWCHVSNSRH